MAATSALPRNEVLQLFWDLSELDQDARLKAAQSLVTHLETDLKQWRQESDDTQANVEDDEHDASASRQKGVEHALRKCSPVTAYCIKRLVKGLASSRSAARRGFATALAEVLQSCHAVDAKSLPALFEGLLETTRAMKGADAKDSLLGRVFGYGALAQAALPVDEAAAVQIVNALLKDCSQRSYLREAGTSVLLDLLACWSDDVVSHVCDKSDGLQQMLTADLQDATPEGLLVALTLWSRLSKQLQERCQLLPVCSSPPPPNFFSDPVSVPRSKIMAAAAAVFSPEYLAAIQPVLICSSSSHPRMHSVWGVLLALLLPGFKPQLEHLSLELDADATATPAKEKQAAVQREAPVASYVESFWTKVVEQGLFSSSHERKYLGFSLFLRLLSYLRQEHVPAVFSRNFLHNLVTNLTGKEPYLHNIAKRCVDRLVSHVEKTGGDSALKLAVAVALQRQGGIGFDQLTKTKTTSKMLQGLDTEALNGYIARLQAAFIHGSTPTDANTAGGDHQHSPKRQKLSDGRARETGGDDKSGNEENGEEVVDARRRQSLELLCAAVRFPHATADNKLSVLRFLAMHAFFSANPGKASKSKVPEISNAAGCSVPVSNQLHTTCASRLLTLLSNMQHTRSVKKARSGKGTGDACAVDTAEDAADDEIKTDHIKEVLVFIRELLKSPAAALSSELAESLQPAFEILRQVDDALSESLQQFTTAAQPGKVAVPQQRCRSLLRLVQLLQLYLLGGLSIFEPGVALDLQRVALEAGLVSKEMLVDVMLEDEEPQADTANQKERKVNAKASKLSTKEGLKGISNRDKQGVNTESSDEDDDVEDNDMSEEDGGGDSEEKVQWIDVLVDTLLSLMAQPSGNLPSAPLRDAAESVFRSCCSELTAAGLRDLLRVVTGSEQGGRNGEEEDIYEEDEDEVEMEAAGDEDEDEEVEEEEHANNTGTAWKDKPSADSSDSDTDDEAFDDEQMFRMESKMAAYMRSLVDQRQSAHQRAEALLNLQFKALACVEWFIKKVPQSSLLVLCVVPLLRALSRAAGAARPEPSALAKRLALVLTSRLAKCRPSLNLSPLSAEEMQQLLKRTLYYSSREKSKLVATAAGALLVMVLRAAALSGMEDSVVTVFSTALKDMCHKKKTRLSVNVMCAAVRDVACVGTRALGVIAEECCKASTLYRQVEALQVLASVFNVNKERYSSLAAAVKANHGPMRAALIHAVEGPFGKKNHVQAINHARKVIEGVKRVGAGQRLAELLGPPAITNLSRAVVNVKAISIPPSVANAVDRLIKSADLQQLVAGLEPVPARVAQLQKLHEKAAKKIEPSQDTSKTRGQKKHNPEGSAEKDRSSEKRQAKAQGEKSGVKAKEDNSKLQKKGRSSDNGGGEGNQTTPVTPASKQKGGEGVVSKSAIGDGLAKSSGSSHKKVRRGAQQHLNQQADSGPVTTAKAKTLKTMKKKRAT